MQSSKGEGGGGACRNASGCGGMPCARDGSLCVRHLRPYSRIEKSIHLPRSSLLPPLPCPPLQPPYAGFPVRVFGWLCNTMVIG